VIVYATTTPLQAVSWDVRANRKRRDLCFIPEGGSLKNVVLSVKFYDHLTTSRFGPPNSRPQRSICLLHPICSIVIVKCTNKRINVVSETGNIGLKSKQNLVNNAETVFIYSRVVEFIRTKRRTHCSVDPIKSNEYCLRNNKYNYTMSTFHSIFFFNYQLLC